MTGNGLPLIYETMRHMQPLPIRGGEIEKLYKIRDEKDKLTADGKAANGTEDMSRIWKAPARALRSATLGCRGIFQLYLQAV